MQRLTIGFLFASILSIHAAVDLRKVLGSVTQVVDMYDSELDRAVPFREMRASLSVLDFLAQNYTGCSRSDIYAAAKLGYAAADDYYKAIDMMYTWCVKAEWSCNFVTEADLNSNKPKVLQLTKEMLQQGELQITESLELLEAVRGNLTVMRAKLTPIPHRLENERGMANSDYWDKRNQRQHAVDDAESNRMAKAGISAGAGLVLALIGGPVGITLGVLGAGIAVALPPAVLDRQVEANAEQQLAIVEGFLRSLSEAVQSTIQKIKELRDKATKEITHNQVMGGYTSASLNLIEMLDDYPLAEMKKLQQAVRAFMKRHGGGKYSSRQRRGTSPQDVRWEDISHAVDAFLNVTAKERELEYWTLMPVQDLQTYSV